MSTNKPRVVKDYEKLDAAIREQIKLAFPYGFSSDLVSYTNQAGKMVTALPFETDEKHYLVRMTAQEARIIIEEDDDFDDDGILKDSVKEDYKEKFADVDYMSDYMGDEDIAGADDDDDSYDDAPEDGEDDEDDM
ncbi:MAG: hypothetical protein ABI207_01230 [Crocinitomicaceae bacterium]